MMEEQSYTNYKTIAKAMLYVEKNSKEDIHLEGIAKHLSISLQSLHNIVTDWSGVTPDKLFEYTSVQYAKSLLNNSPKITSKKEEKIPLLEMIHMTEEESKNNGENLTINYSFSNTLFGQLLIATTSKGICYMGYTDDKNIGLLELKTRFSEAKINQQTDSIQKVVLQFFSKKLKTTESIKIHLKGTPFQLKVWKALLEIPRGTLTTYGNIATAIDKPSASRAVGTAIGKNPIAYLIPCHRVIQASGKLGGYMWGTLRKKAIIGWEISKQSNG